MPSALIFFEQETPYSCVPACLRMVLNHFGIEASEDELRLRSYTTHLGTNARDAVVCVQSYGLHAKEFREASLEELRGWLGKNLYPVLLIDLRPLRNETGRHAIVAEEISETDLIYLDPLVGRQTSSLDVIEKSWQMNSHRAILISSA